MSTLTLSTASPWHVKADQNQFSMGSKENNACSNIAIVALKHILKHETIETKTMNTILKEGSENYQTLLKSTQTYRSNLAANLSNSLHDLQRDLQSNTYFSFSEAVEKDPSCELVRLDDTATIRSFSIQSDSIKESILLEGRADSTAIKNAFRDALEDLKMASDEQDIGAGITIATLASRPISISIAICPNTTTRQKEYFLFDSHGDKFDPEDHKAILHKFTDQEAFLSFIAESLIPKVEEGETDLVGCLRDSATESIPTEFTLTPLVLKGSHLDPFTVQNDNRNTAPGVEELDPAGRDSDDNARSCVIS